MKEDGLLENFMLVNPVDTKNEDALEFTILVREEGRR